MSEGDDILQTQDTYSEGDFDGGDFKPPAEGDHVCVIKEVTGEMKDGEHFTYPRAMIQFAVDNKNDPDDGREFRDWINLPHAQEKDGNRKRRAAILSKLGLISRGDAGTAAKFNWKSLEGLRCIVTVEHSQGKDKEGKPRTYANVPFAGYRALDGNSTAQAAPAAQEAAPVTAGNGKDDFSDI